MKKGFVIGVVTGLAFAGASLVFASSHIQALLNDQIKVTLNGQVQEFKDETTNEIQYPITYHDRTYLPLRTVANLVGVGVDYDASSNTAILISNNNVLDDKYSFFIPDSAHLTIPGGFGAYIGECYYFKKDGTFYWGASEYYNDQRSVAKKGTWRIENGNLVLNEEYELYLDGGKLIEQGEPNGLSDKELIDYKETVRKCENVINKKLEYVSASTYSIDMHALPQDISYEYKMDDTTWFSNVKVDLEDITWANRLDNLLKKQ